MRATIIRGLGIRFSIPVSFALAVAGAVLFAPGAALAVNECGALTSGAITCSNAAYNRGIAYWDTSSIAVTVEGHSDGTTITTHTDNAFRGVYISPTTHATARHDATLTITGNVKIVQTGSATNSGNRNFGIWIEDRTANLSTITIDLGSDVEIGSSTTKMRNRAVTAWNDPGAGDIILRTWADLWSAQEAISITQLSTADITVRNRGTIVADGRGISLDHRGASGNVMVTNHGAITAGTTTAPQNGIHAEADGSGAVTIMNTAAIGTETIKASLAIYVKHDGAGAVSVTNRGDLTGSNNGIAIDQRGTSSGKITVENSGAIAVSDKRGISVEVTNGAGDVSVTNEGAIGSAAARARYGVYVVHTAGTGDITVTNSGDIMTSRQGIRGFVSTASRANLTVEATGGAVVTNGHTVGFTVAMSAEHRGAAGNVTAEVMEGATIVSKYNAGVEASIRGDGNVGRLSVTQGGTISGRTGVRAFVQRGSQATETREAETREASAQPLIGVTWTGTFACGAGTSYRCGPAATATIATAENDMGRVSVGSTAGEISIADAVKSARDIDASEATRYLKAAGIEAFALNPWNVAEVVATGDDPGEYAVAAAVTALFDSGADAATQARAAATVEQFDEILANDEFATITGAAALNTDGMPGLSKTEVGAYFSVDDADRRETLQEVLSANLSDGETAILKAVVSGSDAEVDAALTAAGFTDDADDNTDYWSRVKALRNRFNIGNIRVAVNDGSINSRGDGVRAYYATPHNSNGRIDVAVAEGASVTGAVAGVYAANAGMGALSGWEGASYLPPTTDMTTANLRQQFVTVHGTVTGGSDAAIHLSGGGAVLVRQGGEVRAGSSGRAILVNDPGRSEIVINGAVRGDTGAAGAENIAAIDVKGGGTVVVGVTGSVDANGADYAIRASRASADDRRTTRVIYHAVGRAPVEGRRVTREAADTAVDRVDGAVGGDGVADGGVYFLPVDDEGPTGHREEFVRLNPDGSPNTTGLPKDPPPPTMPDEEEMEMKEEEEQEEEQEEMRPPTGSGMQESEPPFDCDAAMAVDDRCRLYSALPSALLSMNGLPTYEERLAAARSAAGGWARVETSRGDWEADSSTRAGVAWDGRRSGVRVGVDGAAGDDLRVGVSAHGMRGSADMTRNGGKVEMSGVGASVSGTMFAGDGVYVDAQAGATRYEVKLTSQTGRTLKDGAKGTGYALAVEAGRSLALDGGVTVTPRAGFAWSRVSMSDFVDSRLETPVSIEEAASLVGRAGVSVAVSPGAGDLLVVGSAEATHEFSGETETRVEGQTLKASPETTGARFSLGAAHGWDDDRFALQGSASYTTGGSSGDGFGGGLSLSVRF